MLYRNIRNSKSSFKQKYGMIFILLVVITVFSFLSNSFLSMQNFSNILISEAAIGCLALGGVFILVTDEFDLSLGYILCFCMVLGALCAKYGGGTFIVVVVMLAAGILCGFINGLIVTKLKISSFIATLSVGLTLSGISQAVSGGRILNKNIPKPLMNFAQGKVWLIGYCVIFWVILCIGVHLFLNYTVYGRNMYAIGISKKTAAFAGIKVTMVKILTFSLAGFFCGIAAIIMLGQLGAASSAYGTSLLLPAYSIVFLSKAAFSPGRINIPGLIVSILIVGIGSNGVQIIGLPVWGSYMFEGLILILSICFSNIISATRVKKIPINS